MDDVNFYSKLRAVQVELNAPKNQRNNFGNYNYRSCEDILEAVKPVLERHSLTLIVTDNVQMVGERYYVKAEALVTDGKDSHSAYGFAREEDTKKGMDGSQITGAASSYARKYALNGLFLIDDSKDADTNEHRAQTTTGTPQRTPEQVRQVVNQPAEEMDDLLDELTDLMASKFSPKQIRAATSKLHTTDEVRAAITKMKEVSNER